jgi:hypothetical protein
MPAKYTSYGYGDSATWPPYSGHPNDPRAEYDDEAEAREAAELFPVFEIDGEWFFDGRHDAEGPYATEAAAEEAAFIRYCDEQ